MDRVFDLGKPAFLGCREGRRRGDEPPRGSSGKHSYTAVAKDVKACTEECGCFDFNLYVVRTLSLNRDAFLSDRVNRCLGSLERAMALG